MTSNSTVVPLNDQLVSCGLVEDIVAEIGAQRVITKRRVDFSTELEDVHRNREIAKAAACYILGTTEVVTNIGNASIHQKIFPWDMSLWAPDDDYRTNLISAACFIIAEIERIDRQTHTFQNDMSDLPAIIVNSRGHFKPVSEQRHEEVLPLPVPAHPPMPEVVHEALERLAEQEPPPLIFRGASNAPEALRQAARIRHIQRRPNRVKPKPETAASRMKKHMARFAMWGKTSIYNCANNLSDLRCLFM